MLEVAGLRAGYGRLTVLQGLDLSVGRGELLAVVGGNGAGKSTLLRAVSGLIRSTAGRIRIGDADMTGAGAERIARAGLAHVPENRLVFGSLTVTDNLELGGWTRRRRGTSRQRLAVVLELFPRLAQRVSVRAGALSGGEQQMLAIGRALMAEPSIIVLDEPSLGLAPRVVGEITATLGRLRDDGMAVLLVEQNVRAALRIADRVMVMDRGTVTATGTPDELADDAQIRAAYLGAAVAEHQRPDPHGSLGSLNPLPRSTATTEE